METILITGGAKGIGAGIVNALKSKDRMLLIHYNTSTEAAKSLEKQLKEEGFPARFYQANLENPKEMDAMIDQIHKEFKGVDTLINNAGVCLYGMVQDISLEDWNRVFAVNVTAAFYLIQKLLPYMISQKKGCILNLSSVWGEVGSSCESLYSATKGAVNALTKSLAKELGPSNIRVNAIAPGVVSTSMMEGFTEEELKDICDSIPLGYISTPQEIGEVVAYFVSDKAKYFTGQIISPNGGFVID